MWQLNIATLIRFFTAVLLAPCGATAKHGNYYSGKFMFFKLEKKYLLAGVIFYGFLTVFASPAVAVCLLLKSVALTEEQGDAMIHLGDSQKVCW
jgi:hypothetical protein